MPKVRVVYKPDKSVSIIHHAPKSRLSYEQAMEKTIAPKYNANGQQVNPLHGLPYDDIDGGSLPPEREHRNAWEGEKGKPITVNADKKAAIDAAKIIPTEKDQLIQLLDDPDVVQKLKNKTKTQT